MVLHLKLKNFGKIESADISLSNLVLFVGNNNSGKTMVMQLIYGLRKELADYPVTVLGSKSAELNGQLLIRCDRDWFQEIEVQINRYISENKLRILKSIFGTPIPAEEIKVALEYPESAYFVSSISEYQDRGTGGWNVGWRVDTHQYENGRNIDYFEAKIDRGDGPEDMVAEALNVVWKIILSGKTMQDSSQLFLPASRSGLQLLYKHYFAGETDGNMVMPVKDFLRFIQLYSENKELDETRSALVKFGEERLMQGRIIQEGDETFYVEGKEGNPVLLYIASSMIHEITPFIKALNATQRIDWLYCDEAENSLHPLMQREMVRWLIHMVNAGMYVIVSSHSDTMASRFNNLFMLTQLVKSKADYGILSELQLAEADLLRSGVEAGVYEFQNTETGKTRVERLEFISRPLMGYDFELFGKNLDKLYDEAERITR